MPDVNAPDVPIKETNRDKILRLITENQYTKVEIAEIVACSVKSVSSQMSYLRFGKYHIHMHPDSKILYIASEEEHEVLEHAQAEAKANRKKATLKTPAEQAVAIAKTIQRQEKALENQRLKLTAICNKLAEDPDQDNTEEDVDTKTEAKANITLLEIKLKRNKARAESLPSLEIDRVTMEETRKAQATEAADAAEVAEKDYEHPEDEDENEEEDEEYEEEEYEDEDEEDEEEEEDEDEDEDELL